MSNQNELASFKQLLRQVYSAHSTKVKELENEIKTLKEKLTEKERENNSNSNLAECKRCIELEEAFKSCKKALHDQSKLFENFGQKFSIFNSPTLESQDLKNIAKLSSHSQKKFQSASGGSICRNESAISADESTITELKINDKKKNLVLNDKNFSEKAMHDDDNSESFDLYTIQLDSKNNDPLVPDNQNLLKKVMHDDGGSFDVCTVTFPQQLRHDHLNEKSAALILAPDSLDASLDPKIVHEKKCSDIPAKENINLKTSNSDEQKKNSLKCDGDKVSRKRLSSDTLCDKKLKRSNTCQTENKSKVKNGGAEICNLIPPNIIVTSDISDIPVIIDTKVTVKNLGLERDKKIATKNVLDDKVNKNDTPKNPNFPKISKESKLSEISPSLLPSNVNIPLKIIAAVDVSTDDDFQDQVSCTRSNQSEDSSDACDKKNLVKKRKNIKCLKATSKYKMTLDAPPLNYKKPNFKQTKLSKSLFQAKGSTSKKPSNGTPQTKKSNFVVIEDDSSQALQDYFQTSTPFDANAKSPFNVDIDATFIPENYHPETTSVKKNAVEKSHLKNGNLFSNISFPEELESVEKKEVVTGKENDFENYSFSEELESKENMNSFDRLPLPEEPNYKYKNDVVRKKSERKQLNAFDCKECEKYYSELGLSDKEKKERMKKCSRHRAKYTPPSTPDHFWELEFPDTLECKARGYMNETQKVKLNNICNI